VAEREGLAKKGNGNFAYIDNRFEAEKVLVAEFTKTLYSVANDAYVNVFFNAYYVKRYRLIGFDNKKELLEDNSLIRNPNVIVTPHTAFYTKEAEHAIMQTTVENIESFLSGSPKNMVNS